MQYQSQNLFGKWKYLLLIFPFIIQYSSHVYVHRYKDGQEVRADARLIIKKDSTRVETYSLTLNLVKGTDSGDYEIKASNFMGTASSKSRVIVQSEYIPRTPD